MEKSDGLPLKIGEKATFTVKSVTWQKESIPLSDTQYAMTYNDKYTGSVDLATLSEGDVLILDINAHDAFKNASFATGGGDMLVQNGNITKYAVSGKAPRTVLGVKDDGSFKVYAIDGRQSLVSVGISLLDCANLLLNEGYNNVINLDGGGSTTISAQLPGDTASYVTNSPSDGSLRKCATYLLFVSKSQKSHLSGGQVYPYNPVYLAGSNVTLYSLGYDENYLGFGEIAPVFTVNGETLEGNTYTVPS